MAPPSDSDAPVSAPTALQALDSLVTIQLDLIDSQKKELIYFAKDGPNRRTRRHFQTRLERIHSRRVEFIANHNKIIQISESNNDDYMKEDYYDAFEEAYVDTVATVQTEFDKVFGDQLDQSIPQDPNASLAPNVTYNLSAPSVSPFKLPDFVIPKFDGVYTEWPSFHDSFLQVHKNKRVSVTQKFQLLKNSISNKVKSLIGYLDITEENYTTAWTALIERYDNKRVLFTNQFEVFLNQPVITTENAEEIQALHDFSRASVFALNKLGIKTDECGEIFAHIVIKKLPFSVRLDWEKHLGKSVEIPTFNKLIDFLDIRFRALEAMCPQSNSLVQSQTNSRSSENTSNKSSNRKETRSFHVSAKNISCPSCTQSHFLRRCPDFLNLSPQSRKQCADRLKICTNCLGHSSSQKCTSTKRCFTCNGRHHTLLHFPTASAPINSFPPIQSNPSQPNQPQMASTIGDSPTNVIRIASNNVVNSRSSANVLLTTALVDIPDINGNLTRLRALLDQCSQQSIITERAAQRLKLPIISICVGIRPMGETQYKIVNRGLNVRVHSHLDRTDFVDAIVAINASISSNLPLFPLNKKSWPHIQPLPLADPHFADPGQIDILLGGDVFHKIIQSGLCKGQDGEPIAQQTTFGWILSGEVANQNHVSAIDVNCFHVSTVDIGMYIQKFYETEEVSCVRESTNEEQWTVDHYNRTYERQPNGKFLVRLPFKHLFDPTIRLGSSFSMAFRRFKWLQRRFQRDPHFHQAYTQTFEEYKQLDQVKLVETINDDSQAIDTIKHFYLPHHAVFKHSSLTTQLRQVFDASAKSSNGNSLNDILTTGPSLQSDLVTIILNWRKHKFVILADIAKMYRCIDVHPDDTPYQQLLWEEDAQLRTYALKTVTFGVKSSPFLAIKTLHTLADLERNVYPLAHAAIKRETYVDDVTTGSDTIEQTIELSNQLIKMLRGAGFELRKWASNSSEILQHIPNEYCEQNTSCLFNTSADIKALGISWSTTDDSFHFNINFSVSSSRHTKRVVLSFIARLFDPLGWLNPFVTKAKIFLNKLWEQNLGWDQELPANLAIEWKSIVEQFQFIDQIKIPRFIHTTPTNKRSELHFFCDSTLKAYSASAYLRTISENDNIHVNLMLAKSKLTPVRNPLTIPRAELSGAVLAVKLLDSVKLNFQSQIDQIFMWTDSSVVLSWIRGDPKRWSPFISNRVHRILSSTEIQQWRHVVSKDNPADSSCRGLSVSQLRDATIWWKGPAWLSLPQAEWPVSPFDVIADDQAELRAKFKSINVVLNEPSRLDSILYRFSNFNRLRRSFAYLLRFTKILRENIKLKRIKPTVSTDSIKEKIQIIAPLTVEEIETAENALIRWVQHEQFAEEFKSLAATQTVSRTSKLKQLNPFIDEQQMLRVNGRLRNAFMTYDEKYPLIISSKHLIVPLIVRFFHLATEHSGPQLTVNSIRQKFWILNIRTFTRNFIHKCVRCFRLKPTLSTQFMGSLPAPRVNDKSHPFAATIIDYAGPYDIRASKGRGQKSYKGYVAVFTCMATRAIHLEAVGDLTAQSFLHALDRFFARRGLCHDLYSDNGTNFVGASNELNRTQKDFEATVSEKIIPYLSTKHIQWHFSPPGGPHFNGLAEAAVKSMKFHLARIIGDEKLTFEEFSTVLARIEAILNSRPISPISDNPNDFTALTPGHFLIGRPLNARPQPSIDENPTKRHQFMQRMVEHFWHRFRKDILSAMQVRTKWQDKQPNIKINDLVVIKDERFPVQHWPLARVVELHPGSDGLIRTVTLQTAKSLLKRPIIKLGLIPNQIDESPTKV